MSCNACQGCVGLTLACLDCYVLPGIRNALARALQSSDMQFKCREEQMSAD